MKQEKYVVIVQESDDWIDGVLAKLEKDVANDVSKRILQITSGKTPKSHAEAKAQIQRQMQEAYKKGYIDGAIKEPTIIASAKERKNERTSTSL